MVIKELFMALKPVLLFTPGYEHLKPMLKGWQLFKIGGEGVPGNNRDPIKSEESMG